MINLSNVHLLIAEDEAPKLQHLESFVRAEFPGMHIAQSRSVRSSIDAIEANQPDIVLLDMSLPTFDVAPGEPGGRAQGFGGEEVMRFSQFLGAKSFFLVVTQHEVFSEEARNVDFRALERQLLKEYGACFRGSISYSSLNLEWRRRLADALRAVLFEVSSR